MTTCATCLKVRQKIKNILGVSDGKNHDPASSSNTGAGSEAGQADRRFGKEKNRTGKSQNRT